MSRPYFPMFGRDWRDGTRMLTPEERGIYIDLLTLIYDAGGAIPDDEHALRRQLACERRVWRRVRDRLLDLGKLSLTETGHLTNPRAERELSRSAYISERRAEAGRRGGQASGRARRTSDETSAKLREKFGETSSNFSQNARPNTLKTNEPHEANAAYARAFPEPEPYEEWRGDARARDLEPPDPSPPPDPPSAATEPARPPPQPGALKRCLAIAGPGLADPAREAQLHLTAPRIAAWLAGGCDLEADVLPVIQARTLKARGDPIRTWTYFEREVLAARDRRVTGVPPPPDPGTAVATLPQALTSPKQAHPHDRHDRTLRPNSPGAQRATRIAAGLNVLRRLEELESLEGRTAPA